MDTYPKIEINPAGTLVTIRYCGHITASDFQETLVDAALSTLTLWINLRWRSARLWIALTFMVSVRIIRVIPNPAKAIGFNILSLFHYQSDTTISTCEDLAEASSLLE
jgi:hypothetical protein